VVGFWQWRWYDKVNMSENNTDGNERNKNIWAPWRMEYIESLSDKVEGCFLCHHRDNPYMDTENLVLWRGLKCLAVQNLYPYTGGHMLVAPYDHVADMTSLDTETVVEMMAMVRDLQILLADVVKAQGFNVGINIGRCAGAGLPGHLHIHVVPRWNGDTNFLGVIGDVRVIPQSLEKLHQQLSDGSDRLGLPT